MTPGAISHQIRALKQELGVTLFIRNSKRIAITEQDQRFAATVRKSLNEIALAGARADRCRPTLRARSLSGSDRRKIDG